MAHSGFQKLIAIIGVMAVLTAAGFYVRDGFKTYDIKIHGGSEGENISVYVSGEVAEPGDYSVSEGSRVYDVLYAAGGITQNADVQSLSLDAVVTDSSKINVPAKGAAAESAPIVNINTADAETLTLIPYVGEETAKRIVEYRLQNGLFAAPEDIMKVDGIGEKTFGKIKDYIKTEEQP